MDIFTEDVVTFGTVLLVAGVLIGYLGGLLVGRYLGSGKRTERDLAILQSELDAYKQEVKQHFATSADLFGNLTDSYRAVYEHMAGTADKLCEEAPLDNRLGFSPRETLARQDAEAGPDFGVDSGTAEPNAVEPIDSRTGTPAEHIAETKETSEAIR